MRFPDTPPRDFEIRILKWVGLPLLALMVAGLFVWACEVRSGRIACEQKCSGVGEGGFIFIPEDGRVGRVPECICTD